MDTLEIVVIAVVAAFALLALGGFLVDRRRRAATEGQFERRVEQANRDLAAARAADRGWDPGRVEAAARAAFAERLPEKQLTALTLIQVVDPPGIEDDKAVFRAEATGAEHRLTLGRRGDDWVLETLD